MIVLMYVDEGMEDGRGLMVISKAPLQELFRLDTQQSLLELLIFEMKGIIFFLLHKKPKTSTGVFSDFMRPYLRAYNQQKCLRVQITTKTV